MESYREKIYSRYASVIQGTQPVFDAGAAARWGRPYQTYLRGWLPLAKDAPILEVACGSGSLLYLLKTQGFVNLRGVDHSAEQVAIARQVVGDVTQDDAIAYLKKHPGSFDLIVGFDIIEHFTKDEVIEFLESCHASVHPGGRLILKTPNAESPWGSMHRYHDLTHETAFDSYCLSRLLELTGFKGIEAREVGPAVYGFYSLGRFIIWKIIWVWLALWNLVETGGIGSGIYTRIFLISGKKG